jgi:Zn-dependent peptidase ImmA (M78 family)
MTTVEKGNKLEDKFYDYLLNQKDKNSYIFGIYPPELCQIHKKRKYRCDERENDIEFDVVVELRRAESVEPHLVVVFECKNYSGNVPESDIVEFSDKLSRLFRHNAKGIMVVASPLQSGAKKLLEKRRIGLAKYDEDGFEILVERLAEDDFIRKGIFENNTRDKPLKFSAFYNGRFSSSLAELLNSFTKAKKEANYFSVPFISQEKIKQCTNQLLEEIQYNGGRVNLEDICSYLKIDLKYHETRQFDSKNREILGHANFSKREIVLMLHENNHRERFTLGHEVAHFYLQHDKYLRSETLIEEDLLKGTIANSGFNYERLEAQANYFSSNLLLPEEFFLLKIEELRKDFEIRDRGHGYIYVDDQPCNYNPYNSLLSALSLHFGASKNAIEIRLKKMRALNDRRSKPVSFSRSL